jgi:hypothetical protein
MEREPDRQRGTEKLTGAGRPADFFRVFGVAPLMGRTFTANELAAITWSS